MVIANVWMLEIKRHFKYIKARSTGERNTTNKCNTTQVHTKTCAKLYNIVLKRTGKNTIKLQNRFTTDT